MSQLTIEGVEVKIVDATEFGDTKWGDFGRAFSGKARSDYNADHRVLQVRTAEMDVTDALALRLLLQSPGGLECSGDRIGTSAADFHARNIRYQHLTADDVVLTFELHETNTRTAELLFTAHGSAWGSNTFTRSGAVGKYTGSDGILTDAAANVIRSDWNYSETLWPSVPDDPWLLLESPAFTNLVTDDGITAGTGWSSTGTPVITGGVDDPAGGTDAYTVEDDDGAAVEDRYFTTAAVSGTGAKCVVFIVRENTMPASGAQVLYVLSSTDGTVGYVQITAWSGGEPTASATTGTLLGKRYVGNGYWALYVQTASVTSAATLDYGIRPAETAAQTGSIDVHRINGYDGPTPPWSILDASETKNAETLYFPFTHAPQAMCGLVDFREIEDPNWTTEGGSARRVFELGNASGNAPQLIILRPASGDTYQVYHNPGSGAVTAEIDLNPQWGDRVQLFFWLYADGSVNIAGRRQALGSSTWSAITTGSQSAAAKLANDWADDRLYLGSVGTTGRASQLYRSVSFLKGSGYTTTQLLNFAAARLHRRAA